MRSNPILVVAILTGCAAPGQFAWVPLPGTTISYDRAEARCDYETSAATQGTDYTYRTSLGRELDRALRKRDLAEKCMRAQGFRKVDVSAASSPPADPRWKVMEDDWQASRARRQALREQLTANPTAADAAETRSEIRSLNARVSDLERKLSYAPTTPVSID